MASKAVDMNAGRRSQRIAIQAPSKTPDGMGGFTSTWNTVATVWASLEPLTKWDTERIQAMKIQSEVTHKCRMLFRSVLRPSWRLVKNTRTFNILSILNVREENKELEIYCKEIL